MVPIVLGAQTSVVHQDIRVSTSAIALIVESSCLTLWTWRGFDFDTTVVAAELDACVTHAVLELAGETTVVANDLMVSAASIAEVIDVLGVEGSLHGGKTLVCFGLAGVVHFIIVLFYFLSY